MGLTSRFRVNIIVPADGRLTDLASFYTLPSSIIGHERHDELKAAFQYYTVSGAISCCVCITANPLCSHDCMHVCARNPNPKL